MDKLTFLFVLRFQKRVERGRVQRSRVWRLGVNLHDTYSLYSSLKEKVSIKKKDDIGKEGGGFFLRMGVCPSLHFSPTDHTPEGGAVSGVVVVVK